MYKIAIEKYKKTNNSEVELEYKEYSGIVGIDGNIEDVLDDLIRKGMEIFTLKHDVKTKLINYIIENEINIYYVDKNLNDDDKENLAVAELERKTFEIYESIESIITNYIFVSEFKVAKKLNKLYRNFDFMFANKTIRQTIYDNIYTPYRNLYNLIAEKVYHMKFYKEDRGNLAVVINMILELQKEIFDIKYNEDEDTTRIYEKFISNTFML